MVWSKRKHGDVNHYLAQFLPGHDCFRTHQQRFRIDDDASCPACQPVLEDAEHVLFRCPRFNNDREILQTYFNQQLSPETIIAEMVERKTTWIAVSNFAINSNKITPSGGESEKRTVSAVDTKAEQATRRATNSHFPPHDVMIDGGSAGWREVMGGVFSG